MWSAIIITRNHHFLVVRALQTTQEKTHEVLHNSCILKSFSLHIFNCVFVRNIIRVLLIDVKSGKFESLNTGTSDWQ